MTIASQTTSISYPCNGVQTAFTYNFLIPADAAGNAEVDVLVINADGSNAILAPGTYSITGIGDPSGGVVVFPLVGSPLASGQTLVIMRAVPYIQLTSIGNQGFYPHTVEELADYLTFQTQQLAEVDARALQFLPGDTGVGYIPPASRRKGLVLGFDGITGAPIAVAAGSGGGGSSEWSALQNVPVIIQAIDVLTPAAGKIIEFTGPAGAHLIDTPSLAQNFNFSALTGVPAGLNAIVVAGAPAAGKVFEYTSPTAGHYINTPGGGGGGITGPGSTTVNALVTWTSAGGVSVGDSAIIPSANGYSLISAANYAAMRGLLGIGALGLLGDLSTVLLAGTGLAISTIAGVSTLSYTGSSGPVCTWNPSDTTGSNIVLSNSNLTAAFGTGSSPAGVRGTLSGNTGKIYFELKFDLSSGGVFGGMAAATLLMASQLPGQFSHDGFVVGDDGKMYSNAAGNTPAIAGGWAGLAGGGILQIAVDFGALKVWVKPVTGTGSTTWNNNGAANPATGVGGISFLMAAGSLFPFARPQLTTDTMSANFGATSFAGVIPAGFSAYATGSVSGVVSVNGRGGAVSLTGADVSTGLGSVLNTKIAAGTNITTSYNAGTDILTINSTGGGGGGVTSFNGRNGAVTLGVSDLVSLFTAGAGIAIANLGSSLQISATGGGGGVPIGYNGAAENSITPANSATTNTTNLNNLISALNAAGGGKIWFNGPGNYQINGTIHLKSYVDIEMEDGAFLQWTAGGSSEIVSSSSTDVLVHTTLKLHIDEGTSFSGIVFHLHSAIFNDIDVLAIGSNTGSVFVQLDADSTAGQPSWNGRNNAFNTFHFDHQGQCQYGLIMQGITSGYGGFPQVVTDNEFVSLRFSNVVFRGIKINQWADSNTFTGNTIMGISGLNGGGVMVNEGRTNNGSVYNTVFEHIAVDLFGSVGGRFGVCFFESKGMIIQELLVGPTFEGGSFIGTNCTSYNVQELVNTGSTVSTSNGGAAANDSLFIHQKAVAIGA